MLMFFIKDYDEQGQEDLGGCDKDWDKAVICGCERNADVYGVHRLVIIIFILNKYDYSFRDLAARKCLIGDKNVVKIDVKSFLEEDEDTPSPFRIKWAAPETLNNG